MGGGGGLKFSIQVADQRIVFLSFPSLTPIVSDIEYDLNQEKSPKSGKNTRSRCSPASCLAAYAPPLSVRTVLCTRKSILATVTLIPGRCFDRGGGGGNNALHEWNHDPEDGLATKCSTAFQWSSQPDIESGVRDLCLHLHLWSCNTLPALEANHLLVYLIHRRWHEWQHMPGGRCCLLSLSLSLSLSLFSVCLSLPPSLSFSLSLSLSLSISISISVVLGLPGLSV